MLYSYRLYVYIIIIGTTRCNRQRQMKYYSNFWFTNRRAIVVSGIYEQHNILYYSRVFYRPRTPLFNPPQINRHLRNAHEQYLTIESYTYSYIYYKYIGLMIYIDRSRSVLFFFVLLSKLIQKYKQRNYRYYYFAMHRLLSRQAEISTCIIDLLVHASLLLQYYRCIVLYFMAVVL